MKKSKNILKFILIALSILFIILLIIYLINFIKPSNNNLKKNVQAQISNPASTNCIDIGGELEIRTDENGGQYGVCIKNGKECEEWALFRGECEL
ncbi:DUF333 domain-containing protein [Candidatus Woesearchaeota archaeon]|jgi:putative hemolysin|nr:DUF333 domain-containing protein [Candidatus Woesearchaeota archaeon]